MLDIDGLGPVRQRLDPDHLTIVNTTEPSHALHPGNVFRSIVQDGDNLYVVTHGYGTGIFPTLNGFAARRLWKKPDFEIRRELNPYGLLGYPMDEINAVANTGNQSTQPLQPTTPTERPRGLITNEPMPDWPFPPPIFNPR